jgi:hypothetical protein
MGFDGRCKRRLLPSGVAYKSATTGWAARGRLEAMNAPRRILVARPGWAFEVGGEE